MPNRPIDGAKTPYKTVTITEDIISESVRQDSSHCMIAEAVKAAIPGAKYVSVDLQTIRYSDVSKKQRYTYLTPRRAQVALVDFDQGRTPEPFTITLRDGQVTDYAAKGRKAKPKLVRPTAGTGATPTHVPNGGTPPPMGALAMGAGTKAVAPGRRRAYGLRALDR